MPSSNQFHGLLMEGLGSHRISDLKFNVGAYKRSTVGTAVGTIYHRNTFLTEGL